MSLFVLDTDMLTLYWHDHPVVSPRVDACPPDELAVTVMTIEEQLSGWYSLLRRATQPPQLARAYQELAESVECFSGWHILPFPESAIAQYDQLAAMRLNVRKMDLRIAAITQEYGGVLVTRNLRDFQRVPGLTVEDWSV
jgi:tRNA(fMet)-specific endonuclease VapC